MKKALALCLYFVLIYFFGHNAEPAFIERGITFGMTPEEVQQIETQNNNQLHGTFSSAYAYELYYENDISLYSKKCVRMEYDFDTVNKLLFQVYYVTEGGEEDFSYIKNQIVSAYGDPTSETLDISKYSIKYQDIGERNTDVAHWILTNKNMGIDLWYNAYNVVFVVFYDTTNPASYGALPKLYSDETGVSFEYVDGWNAYELGAFYTVKIIFSFPGDNETLIQYQHADVWDYFKANATSLGFTRQDIDDGFLTSGFVTTLMYPEKLLNLREETFNGYKFYLYDYKPSGNYANLPSNNNYTCAITMQDSYAHIFMLSSPAELDELMPAFNRLLSTVTFAK